MEGRARRVFCWMRIIKRDVFVVCTSKGQRVCPRLFTPALSCTQLFAKLYGVLVLQGSTERDGDTRKAMYYISLLLLTQFGVLS